MRLGLPTARLVAFGHPHFSIVFSFQIVMREGERLKSCNQLYIISIISIVIATVSDNKRAKLSERQRLNARHKALQQQELSQDMSHYMQNQFDQPRTKQKAHEKVKQSNIPELRKPDVEQTPVNSQSQADVEREARKKAFMEKRQKHKSTISRNPTPER